MSEVLGLAFAIVILIVAFGSVLAMGLPVGVALFGIGIGTDYALLIVTGSVAVSIDFSDYLASRLPWFFAAVLTLSFLLLMVVFRSILVPAKAVENLLSIGAADGYVAAMRHFRNDICYRSGLVIEDVATGEVVQRAPPPRPWRGRRDPAGRAHLVGPGAPPRPGDRRRQMLLDPTTNDTESLSAVTGQASGIPDGPPHLPTFLDAGTLVVLANCPWPTRASPGSTSTPVWPPRGRTSTVPSSGSVLAPTDRGSPCS